MLDVVMNARVTRLEALHSTGLMSLNHAVFSFAYAGSAFLTGWVREAGAVPGVVFACIGAGVALMSLRMVTAAPVETEDTTVSSGGGYLGVAIWTGLSHHAAPNSSTLCAVSRRRVKTRRGNSACRRRRAMCRPITPRPTKAMEKGMYLR
jgi:hypothetical protein